MIRNEESSTKGLIQVCSDLHLETNDIQEKDFVNIIKPCAEVLILAGDIGDPFSPIFENFISYCSSHFIYVLFVSGNHEYYGYSIVETDFQIENLFSDYSNVIYLNNKTFEYNELLFIGTTLWTEISNSIQSSDLSMMYDYKKIKDFSPNQCNDLFMNNIAFIKENIEKKECIVITHHAPSYKCISDEYKGDKSNCFFASHLDDYIENKNVIAWVYGHTHYNIEYSENNVLYANCYRTNSYNNEKYILKPYLTLLKSL